MSVISGLFHARYMLDEVVSSRVGNSRCDVAVKLSMGSPHPQLIF